MFMVVTAEPAHELSVVMASNNPCSDILIPLTAKADFYKLKLHLGFKRVLPEATVFLIGLRSKLYEKDVRQSGTVAATPE